MRDLHPSIEPTATLEEREYIERLAILFADAGLARMAGRILGWLLICDPPGQTAEAIERAIGASKGAVSMNLRVLLTAQLVERSRPPGSRRDVYRLKDGAWSDAVFDRMGQIRVFRDVFAAGLDMLADAAPERRQRLADAHDLYIWLETEIPSLWERWKAERDHLRHQRSQDIPREPSPQHRSDPGD